ncbi:hypothetical protein KC367_g8919 [Hortaea werneckii]|uniref:Amino acid transporter n=1 Tax=Hortaea werneckii TaxID=91943 RepID=A0A3M7I3Q6_HORWE|nr:hypothetical protein KC358_g13495 [Hortaea werneckii]KAI6842494.1 hypothetical protein KC350_g5055 [Hortaea werneckii]KAI6914975.1 hypothetical protein KC348_g12147 [Hortaea werneckii]KAI6938746.1 hypothetical protein KC341_g4700 [Hortaea werneckii]KAI6963240.1 hypothetical protein KC321_g11330 [Hortaea werneckii]
MSKPNDTSSEEGTQVNLQQVQSAPAEIEKIPWTKRLWKSFLTPGSALQIIVAAIVGVAIGIAVSATVSDVPEAAPVILEIPGDLWLRALKATVLPLIVTAIISAMQNLKAMTGGDGAKLARWTIGYYVCSTIVAIVQSMILVVHVWKPLMVEVSGAALEVDDEDTQESIDEGSQNQAHDIVVQVAQSFIPSNIVSAIANDELLSVLVTSVVVGLLIKGPDSSLLRAVKEVERIVGIVIAWLIKLAPIGVFFLILANLMTLNIEEIGINVGVLIGGAVTCMAIHIFVIIPIVFFGFTRQNPYSYWLKNSPAWITAWGSASSAATIPVTLRCVTARGVPQVVSRFTVPLGALINMDGTAIYFPLVVVFLATTQGMELNVGDYVIIVLLATLSSIATTPIPSASLVITIMIANSVGVPVTGMYAVVVAFDWFVDRFRTMTNVSGDMYAARVMHHVTKLSDDDAPDMGTYDAVDETMDKSGTDVAGPNKV